VIFGWLTLSNSAAGDIWGDLTWQERPLSGTPLYISGFQTTEEALGSSYVYSNKQPILNFTSAQISLSGENLSTPFTNLISIGANNIVTNLSPNALTVTITPSTEVFHGTVVEPVTKKHIPFSAALLQKQQTGVGLFDGTNQTGAVLLTPSP
jgi:hypothetical protein